MSAEAKYSVLLRALPEQEGGGWLAIVPDLPGCLSDGDTPTEALANVGDAVETWLAAAAKHGVSVPEPDSFLSLAFPQEVPDDVRHQAERIAREVGGESACQKPDQHLLHAVYAQLARAALQRTSN
jgi:antitoxin HicB